MLSNDVKAQIRDQIKDKLFVGSIFYATNFEFEETGEVKNKYCVILSTVQKYYYILFCLTTSQVDKYKKIMSPSDYVFIPAGTECFELDTMIRINNQNIWKLSEEDFLELTNNRLGVLPQNYLDELLEKIQKSDDVKNFYKNIILGK